MTTVLRVDESARADDPVATRIRSLRLGLGWSFKRLSEATAGLATSFLFNIENGRKVPSEDVAARIASALGDTEHEPTYRAWARVKSRGRNGRVEHETMQAAWEQLRRGFDGAPAARREPAAEASRLRVPVLAEPLDPGDGVRPPADRIANTLSLDPQLYGADAAHARARFAGLRRPFAFALAAEQAARVAGLPAGYLAIVSRDGLDTPEPGVAYVVRCGGRLEVIGADVLRGGAIPTALRADGLTDAAALRGALLGRIALLLADVRS